MADPSSKANMDPNYEGRLRDLAKHAKEAADALRTGGQVKWFRPEQWSGEVFDLDAYTEPFNRNRANDDFVAAVRDPKAPGTTGDLVATTTMIDQLACMERAFRNRHTMRRPRAFAHALSRLAGLGNDSGPLILSNIDYVSEVLKEAKA